MVLLLGWMRCSTGKKCASFLGGLRGMQSNSDPLVRSSFSYGYSPFSPGSNLFPVATPHSSSLQITSSSPFLRFTTT